MNRVPGGPHVVSPDRPHMRVDLDLLVGADQRRGELARGGDDGAVGRVLVEVARQLHALDGDFTVHRHHLHRVDPAEGVQPGR